MSAALRVLRAAWYGMRAALTSRRARALLWYAPWLLGAAVQAYVVVVRVIAGELPDALTSAILAGLLALWPVSARREFREAWSDGYVEGVFTLGDAYRSGTVPAALLRQATTGYLAPEPWDAKPWQARQQPVMREEET